jgi:hypothetical protein
MLKQMLSSLFSHYELSEGMESAFYNDQQLVYSWNNWMSLILGFCL